MSAAAPTMTRCPCGGKPREATLPCGDCDRMVPGQEAPPRPALAPRLPSRIDRAFPHTSLLVRLGFGEEASHG